MKPLTKLKKNGRQIECQNEMKLQCISYWAKLWNDTNEEKHKA